MKKVLLASAALAACFASLPAAAQCGDMCIDGGEALKFAVGGNANFGGFGGAVFTAPEGEAKVNKEGYSLAEILLQAEGALCGANCQDGSFKAKMVAGEMVQATAWGKSLTSGEDVTVANQGGAFANGVLTIQKLGFQPAAAQ